MESISRISSLLETARDLTLEAAQSAGSARGFSNRAAVRDLPFAQVKKLLDSRNDREIMEGLRRVISMMYRSKPCLPYFPSIVKNIASPNIEIKKLVYIYLLHYAESEPDLALLSINTIQKTLTDQSPQVRALALRVMSGIRVPVISQIVSLGIKRGSGDMSPYVRKAAALAIPKCYSLDPKTFPQLLEYLENLLGDKQYYVVGSAIVAFLQVCPERIDLIHRHYRGIVRKLVDMDEWSQLATLKLLTLYARKCFPRRKQRTKNTKTQGFYDDEGAVERDESTAGQEAQARDHDLELFLKACKPLLLSRNSAVIIAVIRCFISVGRPEDVESAIGPLIALLRSPRDVQHVALINIVSICLAHPEVFVAYTTHFLIHTADPPQVWRLKMEVLTLIFPHCGINTKGIILSELEHFTKSPISEMGRESVQAVGRCAQSDSSTSMRCLRLLLQQISSPDGNLVAESLTVIRHLIQQDPSSHTETIIVLAKHLDTTMNAEARASIIWLVGEFAGVDDDENIAPDVLRILAKGFADEPEAAKLQIILLAAKVYVHHLNRTQAAEKSQQLKKTNGGSLSSVDLITADGVQEGTPDERPQSSPQPEHPIAILWKYISLLARYDTSYDLRDRARTYKALLANPSSTQLASLLLLAPKPVPHTPSPSESRKGLLLGSASLVVGQEAGPNGLLGYEPLPEWVKEGEEPDPKLREEAGVKTEYASGNKNMPASEKLDSALKQQRGEAGRPNGLAMGSKDKTLDDWLAEGEDDEEQSEETDEETEEDSEEEDESLEEDEEDDEDSSEGEGEGEGEGDRLVK